MVWAAVAIGASAVIGGVSAKSNQKAAQRVDAANRAQDAAFRAEENAQSAPYRQRLADLYADPNKFMASDQVQIPLQSGLDASARSLSTQGNPLGSGNALQALQNQATKGMWGALSDEKDRLGGFGLRAQRAPMQQQFFPNQTGAIVQDAIGAGLNAYGQQQNNKAFADQTAAFNKRTDAMYPPK